MNSTDENILKAINVKKPHKHAELIKAWADGAQIQTRTLGYDEHGYDWYPWKDDNNPAWSWSDGIEFRIKPTPKPDIHVFANIAYFNNPSFGFCEQSLANIKVVFDGETHELKQVVVL